MNYALINRKFVEFLGTRARLPEKNMQNPYIVTLKDFRGLAGRSPNYVLPSKGTLPKLEVMQGVQWDRNFDGLKHKYDGEEIIFDMEVTNQLPLLPVDAANIGPDADLEMRVTQDTLEMSLKTANMFTTKVVTNNVCKEALVDNVELVDSSALTAQYVYKDINEKIDFLISNGYMPEDLTVVGIPTTMTLYNQGRRENPKIIYTPEEERTRSLAAGVQMQIGRADWLMSAYEWTADKTETTKKVYMPSASAQQVRYIVAPKEAIYWDIAEIHTVVEPINNSTGIAGSFMERIGAKLRDQRKEFVFVVKENKA